MPCGLTCVPSLMKTMLPCEEAVGGLFRRTTPLVLAVCCYKKYASQRINAKENLRSGTRRCTCGREYLALDERLLPGRSGPALLRELAESES